LALSQSGLARALGVAPNTIARWERGEQRISNPERVSAAVRQLERAHAGSSVTEAGHASTTTAWSVGSPRRQQHNLPTQLSRFIGRQHELAEVHRLLRGTRLLTLTGTGGIGKTRLALEVARDFIKDYPDGVWLIELGPIGDPLLVAQAVATVLGIPEEIDIPLIETLERATESRRQVLLIDNCEHVLGAVAGVISRLLRASPESRILATSREPLGLGGETVWRVPPLSLPQMQTPIANGVADQSEAVHLFLDRAKSAQPGFALTSTNATPLLQICQRMDGIPLAIELAAACVTFMTPQQMLERLDESERFLKGMDRSAPERHLTMFAAIQWSYELLSDNERQLFARLSLFAGGFSLEAAESVCVGEDIRSSADIVALLRGLVTKSLVIADPATNGAMRYRLLEPLRSFGQDVLRAGGEADAVHRRHAQFYVNLARQSNLVVTERAGGLAWPSLTHEHDNLHVALRWLLDSEEVGGAQIVGTALAEVLRLHGHLGEARALFAQLMALPSASDLAVPRAGLLLLAGQLACFQGDFSSARELLKQSVAISRELGLAAGIVRGLMRLSEIDRAQGNYASARTLVHDALLACPTGAAGEGLAASPRIRLALIDLDEGNYESACAAAEEFLPIVRAGGWLRIEAQALMVLGVGASYAGHFGEAFQLLKESLARWNEGDRWGAARTLVELSRAALNAGDEHLAASFIADSLTVCRDMGDPWGAAVALEASAVLDVRAGRMEPAVRLAEAAAALRERSQIPQSPREKAWLNEHLGSAQRVLGRARSSAARQAGRALTMGQSFELALRHPTRRPPTGLTKRETEVVRLLAAGKTNRQIAERLVIALPTANRHVANILNKLRVQSRSQIAVWAIDQGLRASA
jgi:predicted ATPase/DNA-binding CsgD family transcriptional regulator